MRNIVEVIEQIKAVAPAGTTIALRLDSIIDSVRYAAPESMRMWWGQLQEVLMDEIPPDEYPGPDEEWKFEALSIFSTMPVEAIILDHASRSHQRRVERGK